VLKQSGVSTAHYLRIVWNIFNHIRRGDAIGLNSGADTGNIVSFNTISDVTANGGANMGLGISCAGLAGYGATETQNFRRSVVEGNIISDIEAEAIHFEASSFFDIIGNIVSQEATGRKGTGRGIATWGSTDGRVAHNKVSGYASGIYDDIGAANSVYILSSDGMVIENNDIRDCTTRGMLEGLAGQGRHAIVRGNKIRRCPIGIEHQGGANTFYSGNTTIDCPKPFKIDANPTGKASVNATARQIGLRDNEAYMLNGTTPKNEYLNMAGTIVTGGKNSFPVVFSAADAITYNTDGTVATSTEDGVLTTFTYNTDGTVATEIRQGLLRTWTYDTAGNPTSSTLQEVA